MFVFYQAIKKLIKNFRPILKFASVKAIVFATYYQSLAVQASSMSPENTLMWNDFILCIEMVFFAGLLMIAFPTSGHLPLKYVTDCLISLSLSIYLSLSLSCSLVVTEFQGGIPDSKFIENVRSVLSVHDVMQVSFYAYVLLTQFRLSAPRMSITISSRSIMTTLSRGLSR
jgi:hypothetical protein